MADIEKAAKSIKKYPRLIVVALVILIVANLLNFLAFSTTAWGRIYSISGGGFYGVGLWRICSSGATAFFVETFCTDTTGWPQDWYGAAQSFAVLGFLGITGGLVLLLVYLCVNSCKGRSSLLFGTSIFILVTAVFYLIGIIIFGVEFEQNYGRFISGFGSQGSLAWSFILAVISMVLMVIAGILLLHQSRNNRKTSFSGSIFSSSSKKQAKKKPAEPVKIQPVTKTVHHAPPPGRGDDSSRKKSVNHAPPPTKAEESPRRKSAFVQSNAKSSPIHPPVRSHTQIEMDADKKNEQQKPKQAQTNSKQQGNQTKDSPPPKSNVGQNAAAGQGNKKGDQSHLPDLNAGPVESNKAPTSTAHRAKGKGK